MSVREQLREEEPLLYDALERSWEIAHKTWLPAIKPSMGSHSAYPHLHNMEQRLEDLVREFGESKPLPFQLSPVEKYLILAAILFHDLGKAVQEKDHALWTWNMLMGYKDKKKDGQVPPHWAEYGIPSDDLAKTIARLSLYHDPPDECKEVEDHPPAETTLDPYGRVREPGLAAVLVLLDHLDTSHLRAMPTNVSKGPKAFRNLIQGVEIDSEARLVRSVLGEPDPPPDKDDARAPSLEPRKLEHHYLGPGGFAEKWRPDRLFNREIMLAKAAPDEWSATRDAQAYAKGKERKNRAKALAKAGLVFLRTRYDANLSAELSAVTTSLADRRADPVTRADAVKALRNELASLIAKIDGPDLKSYHQLATVQADLRGNRKSLIENHAKLRAMGITLDDWVIEFHEHIFDGQGRETYEPILDAPYLKRVAGHMWSLSRRVFGASLFDYETLAAELRDARVERVRRAVRRLKVLTDDLPHLPCGGPKRKPREFGAIECDDAMWKWRVTTDREGKPCAWVWFEDNEMTVEARLGKLKAPEE